MSYRFTSNPEDYAITTAKESLGYEDWKPTPEILDRLKKKLPVNKRGDVSEVLQCLLKWELSEESSHMFQLTNILSETEPRRLSSQEEAALRKYIRQRCSFERSQFSIRLLVEDWLAKNHS